MLRISELITELETFRAAWGDVPVVAEGEQVLQFWTVRGVEWLALDDPPFTVCAIDVGESPVPRPEGA